MDEQRKRKRRIRRSIIVLAIVLVVGMLITLPIMCMTYCSEPKPTGMRFSDINEMMDTLTDLVKYPSYFPEGFNFFEDNSRQIEVLISVGYTFVGNPNRWKVEDISNYTVGSTNDSLDKGEEWRLNRVGVGHGFRERGYFHSPNDDKLTHIGQVEGFELYFWPPAYDDPRVHDYTYVYLFFSTEQEFLYYLFSFSYNGINSVGGYFCEDLYAYTLEEAHKMFDSLKTYEEMRLFLQTTNQ